MSESSRAASGPGGASASGPTKVAVCLCTCARPEPLAECLAAIAAALRAHPEPGLVAVVVVDNAPGGRAGAVCAEAAAALPVPLRVVEEPERGISFARNRAVREALAAGADAVAFLDDDDLPHPDWLARLLARARETGAELVFGGWVFSTAEPLRGWQRDLKLFRAPDLAVTNRFGLPAAAGTYNVLIARRLLERMAAAGDHPPFAPALARTGGSDTDFFLRARASGASFAIAPDSLVTRRWDASRTTFAGVLRRGFRLGHSNALHDRAVLPPERQRHKRRRVALRLARRLLATPLHLLPPRRFARHAFDVARLAGDAAARFGERRYLYYGSEADVPSEAGEPGAPGKASSR